MLSKQQKYFILLPILMVGTLLWDQWSTRNYQQQSHIIGWKDHLLILEPNTHPVLWGEKNEQSTLYTKSLLPFGSEPLETTSLDTTTIINHSVDDIQLLFLPKDTDINTHTLPNTSLQSDWWVLENTLVPEYMPPPSKGILFIGSHKPGKSLITFAQENNIPLLSVNQVKAFWLQRESGTWKIKIDSSLKS